MGKSVVLPNLSTPTLSVLGSIWGKQMIVWVSCALLWVLLKDGGVE